MTAKEKANELIAQFGVNAKYVVLEIMETIKPAQDRIWYNETMNIEYWREVKLEIEKL